MYVLYVIENADATPPHLEVFPAFILINNGGNELTLTRVVTAAPPPLRKTRFLRRWGGGKHKV